MSKDFISASMVSKVTGISYGTVMKHIEKGLLPAYRNEGERNYKIDIGDMEIYAYDAYGMGYYMYNPYEQLHDRMRLYGLLETL